MSSTIIAVDPGARGAAVVRDVASGKVYRVFPHRGRQTVADAVMYCLDDMGDVAAVVERVWASPVMGSKHAFSFGGNYEGWMVGFLVAGIPAFTVTPQAWQKVVVPHIETSGDQRKQDLKSASIALFDLPIADSKLPPKTRITDTNCDALLLSEYALRQLAAGKPLGERA